MADGQHRFKFINLPPSTDVISLPDEDDEAIELDVFLLDCGDSSLLLLRITDEEGSKGIALNTVNAALGAIAILKNTIPAGAEGKWQAAIEILESEIEAI